MRIPSLAVAALLLAAAFPAAAAADDAAVVADPPGWADADADAMLDALVGVVERDREGPLGQAALVAARPLWASRGTRRRSPGGSRPSSPAACGRATPTR